MPARRTSSIPRYKRHRKPNWGRRIGGFLLRLVLAFLLFSLVAVLAYRFINPPITATMLGDILAGRGATRDWMPIERIDRDMVRAAIAAEDGKFCSHSGFDLQAIEEAAKRNASGGRIRGGSTISQQTAKNVFLWQGGGYARKGLEAWFTLLMEAMWTKQRIMEVYLNVAETGIGTYGVNAGAMRYFGHDASTLTRSEASRLAAVLPLPKTRGAIAPKGFTRRYGGTIEARLRSVVRDGLDSCVYRDVVAPPDRDPPASSRTPTVPGEEYESANPPANVDDPAGEPAPSNETKPAEPAPSPLPPSDPPPGDPGPLDTPEPAPPAPPPPAP